MRKGHFIWEDAQGNKHYVYEWLPSADVVIKGFVQIAHGMAETAARYERLAVVLTQNGYAVYANDHLGHGQTAGSLDAVGKFGKDSFHTMADIMGQITMQIRNRYEYNSELPIQEHKRDHLPLFILGHSMGSFLTQYYMVSYMERYPAHVQGIMLSGSNGKEGPALHAGIAIATVEAAIRGDHFRSLMLTALSFGNFNARFKPNRTAFDWLSRDEDEVDAYMKDPYCGGIFTSGYFRDFFKGLKEIHQPQHVNRIRKDVPIYIFSGEEDPVGGQGKGVRRLIRGYEKLGIQDISYKLYPGGRHEMLNEINRDEVMRDIVARLDSWMAK
ncbi:alpha/beta fold hydrolase [Paenibacillus qinlingensis]|uniref:Alpha-beta hydrolase superfamily lysophospholipase n=1 Tax=Paenibacillus qinlingensis TaxID=1837343 RepID=A0ABU1NQI2_9BACL|nr:alpha/beta fold hydrolase [Paenibacillus qinlingensis]MDR6549729.1 alpha-beta hydrolase superfamily lysophospholipase [Paenibacillus qinlingensis]